MNIGCISNCELKNKCGTYFYNALWKRQISCVKNCLDTDYCGEKGNWALYRPLYGVDDEQIVSECCVCSSDYNQEITAMLTRYHSGANVTTKKIDVLFCPKCGRKL